MRQYFPIDVALDDDLFYSYRLSMGIFDSLISKDEEEKIKSTFRNKKSSENNEVDLYRQELLKKINLNENDLTLESFTETNNFLSSIGKLENEFIHLLFQFSEIITSNNADSKLIIGNEFISYDYATLESCEYIISPISSNIIGFVDYIDTRNDIIKSCISKLNKKISDPSPFIYNKQKGNKNDMDYIKLLLRVSFIKSISLLKMYGKIFPIYLFDGSQLLIKIKPMFNPSNEACTISYKVIIDKIDSPSVNVNLNYYQFRWFNSWKNKFRIPTDYCSFQNVHPFQLPPNKKLRIHNVSNPDSTSTTPRKAAPVVDESLKDDSIDEKLDKEISSYNEDLEVHNTFVEEENGYIPELNFEDNSTSPFSKTTNDVINELLNKPNSDPQIYIEKRKRSKKSKSLDTKNSQDYVDKLIKQQTMQLFNI